MAADSQFKEEKKEGFSSINSDKSYSGEKVENKKEYTRIDQLKCEYSGI